jgi:DNA repair protein RecO (recombination protein O)
MYYYVDINKIDNISVDSTIVDEINNFLDDYYERYTGIYLKTKNFLKNLKNI